MPKPPPSMLPKLQQAFDMLLKVIFRSLRPGVLSGWAFRQKKEPGQRSTKTHTRGPSEARKGGKIAFLEKIAGAPPRTPLSPPFPSSFLPALSSTPSPATPFAPLPLRHPYGRGKTLWGVHFTSIFVGPRPLPGAGGHDLGI